MYMKYVQHIKVLCNILFKKNDRPNFVGKYTRRSSVSINFYVPHFMWKLSAAVATTTTTGGSGNNSTSSNS